MAGFDYNAARSVLHVSENYQIEAMAAIGKPGRKEDLPEALQEREAPSTRLGIGEIAAEGEFRFS